MSAEVGNHEVISRPKQVGLSSLTVRRVHTPMLDPVRLECLTYEVLIPLSGDSSIVGASHVRCGEMREGFVVFDASFDNRWKSWISSDPISQTFHLREMSKSCSTQDSVAVGVEMVNGFF